MKHIKGFQIFELYTPEIKDYLDDLFLEIKELENYNVDIIVDSYIQEAVKTESVIYGKNFIYPSDSQRRYNILPGFGNKDWKLGFIVNVSKAIPGYYEDPSYSSWSVGRMTRKQRVRNNRDINSYKKMLNKNTKEIIEFMGRKIQIISKRCPREIYLHGVKQDISGGEIHFTFAFIYKEFE